MTEQVVELKQEELKELLARLLEWDALELCEQEEEGVLLIPYLMNDAAESYLRLEGCRIQGSLSAIDLETVTIELVQNEEYDGLLLRDESDLVCTLWYRSVKRITKCFSFFRIGHTWRKKSGEEVQRRLVNLLCVLHDKLRYLGDEWSSREEQELTLLAECPPILYFTPINQSILHWYEASERGWNTAIKLANEIGDQCLAEELTDGKNLFLKGKRSERHIKRIAERLLLSEHQLFWSYLEKKLEQVSSLLPAKEYDLNQRKMISEKRERVFERYRSQGFTGNYPEMVGKDPQGKMVRLSFFEQQPFTIMEESDFTYLILSLQRDQEGNVLGTFREEEKWLFLSP